MKTVNFLKMVKSKLNLLPMFILLGVLVITSCDNEEEAIAEMVEKSIVEVASEAGQFSNLIEAAQKAGLADFLSTEDNLTVFAPTDDAFAMLLTDLGLNSLDDIDATTLGSILKYHVIGNKVMSSDLSTGYFPTLSTFSGNNLSVFVNITDGVAINKNTNVTAADIEASNGVIHVIDKVILPPSVVNIALDNDNFTTLVAAVVKAGLVDALSAEGPFTVFAPTNDAFAALFSDLGVAGIEDLTTQQLAPILTYHVVLGNVLSTDLENGEVGTLNEGKKLNINVSAGVKINSSSVVVADIQGANGVVHVIDKVLIPQ